MSTIPQFSTDSPLARISGESTQSNAALLEYAFMGADRSHVHLARKIGKSRTIISRWSFRDAWVPRVAAWDKLQSLSRQESRAEIVEDHDLRIIAVEYETLVSVNREIVQRLDESPDSFTSYELVKLSRELTHRLDARLSEQRTQRNTSLKLRFQVLERDGFTCRYCGRTPVKHGIELHVDHIFPASKGGTYTLDNLVTSCGECNVGKGDVILMARQND